FPPLQRQPRRVLPTVNPPAGTAHHSLPDAMAAPQAALACGDQAANALAVGVHAIVRCHCTSKFATISANGHSTGNR
ncbi:hypothetical protein, partial [Xanthomonas euvesicatoria]|uniref:hypothetical protein n=1 Tax=Xanthomonas euvesicatoria TaxID=456327 RepID=UPI0032B57EF1